MTKLARGVAVVAVPALAVWLAACNPYVAAVSAVSETYEVTQDPRSLSVQASDTEIEAKIKANLVASPVPGTAMLGAYSRNGVVVLTGVVPYGSEAGRAAVEIARSTPGVRRIETFFVPRQPSRVADLELTEEIKAKFVADARVVEPQVQVVVYGSHVVLIGVVSDWAAANAFVEDARSVTGVGSVRSYIQVM